MTNESRICPLCRKEVEIQHTPAIDNATGKLAHDYCLRIENIESFNRRKREYIQRAAKATMTYIEQVAAKHGIELPQEPEFDRINISGPFEHPVSEPVNTCNCAAGPIREASVNYCLRCELPLPVNEVPLSDFNQVLVDAISYLRRYIPTGITIGDQQAIQLMTALAFPEFGQSWQEIELL